MRFSGLAVMMALVLSGCGGGSGASGSPAPATDTGPTTAATASTTPSVAGTPAPEDLSDLLCHASVNGVWSASGVLRNQAKKAASYQISVFVGTADGKDAKALTKEYAMITAGGSIKVALSKIPAAKDATQCYVQVLRK